MVICHAGLFPIDIPVFQTTGYPKKSYPLFLNYLPNAPYWQHNPFRVYSKNTLILLIFLQKRNINVKYKRSTSPFLCKENRIRTIHVSVAIESNTLILELVTAVLSGTHVLYQVIEIQVFRNAFSAYEHLGL